MKQILGVVLHQASGAFHVAVLKRDSGFYGKWSCKSCGAEAETNDDGENADQAFTLAKDMIALHQCDRAGKL